MSAALVAQDDVRAQNMGLLSTSTVTPAEVGLYAEIKLDPENPELQELDQLLLRLGSEESLIEAIEQTAEDATGGVDIANAEVAFVMLPSALESAAGTDVPSFGELTDPDTVADELAQTGTGVGSEGIAFVIRPTDVAAFQAQVEAEAGPDAETEEYLGHEIVSYVEDDGETSYFVIIDDFFVYATAADDAKRFVDASLDGGDSLASVDEFVAASDALPAERVAFAYLNGGLFLDAAAATDDPTVAPFIDELGGQYRAHIGATLGAEEDGISFESVMVPANGLPVRPKGTADALTYAERMPADTVAFASGYDLGETLVLRGLGLALIAGFGSITSDSFDDTEATPVPMTVDQMYEAVAQFLGFNLKLDFLDQLTGPYAFGVWGLDAQNPAELSAVVISDTNDEVVLGDTIGSISFLVQAAGQGEVRVVSRTVGGSSVNNVTFDADGTTMSIDFGVVGDQFVLGLGDGVNTVLVGPDGSLADSPRYMDALAHLPAEYESIQYVDVAALAKLSETAAASDLMGDLVASPVAGTMAETQPDTFASVTYVEDGYSRTSAIIVFP
jgi:hypothetical protein